jgi:hypothetical protein
VSGPSLHHSPVTLSLRYPHRECFFASHHERLLTLHYTQTMCNDCLQECDLTVCICGCFDIGLQCNAAKNGSGLGDRQALVGLGFCGLIFLG